MNEQTLTIIVSVVVATFGGWVAIYKMIQRKLNGLVTHRAQQLSSALDAIKAKDDFKRSTSITILNTDESRQLEAYFRRRGCRKVRTTVFKNSVPENGIVVIDRPDQAILDAILSASDRDDFIAIIPGRLNVDMKRISPVNSPKRVWLEMQATLEERFDFAQNESDHSPAEC